MTRITFWWESSIVQMEWNIMSESYERDNEGGVTQDHTPGTVQPATASSSACDMTGREEWTCADYRLMQQAVNQCLSPQ